MTIFSERHGKNLKVPEFAVHERDAGVYRLEGELTFSSSPVALRETSRLFRSASSMTFDLGDVSRVDSAGLALLVEWQRLSLAEGGRLHYANFPDQLLAIARVAGVDEMLLAFSN